MTADRLLTGSCSGTLAATQPSRHSGPRDARADGWRLVTGLTLMFRPEPARRGRLFRVPLGRPAWLALTGPGGAKQQVVDDPVPPQELHLPQQDAGGGAVPEGGRR